MAKSKKKRNKAYRGRDAANRQPKITRISAVNRSRLGQWWFDRKKMLKPVIIISIIAIIIVWLLIELVVAINS